MLLRQHTSWRLFSHFIHHFLNLLSILSCANINSSYSPQMFLFLIKFVDFKIIQSKFKSLYGQYLTPRQMCSSTFSYKIDSFSSPGWRISIKSSTMSSSIILFFVCFLKIFTCYFHVVLNVVICWISVKKLWKKVICWLSA